MIAKAAIDALNGTIYNIWQEGTNRVRLDMIIPPELCNEPYCMVDWKMDGDEPVIGNKVSIVTETLECCAYCVDVPGQAQIDILFTEGLSDGDMLIFGLCGGTQIPAGTIVGEYTTIESATALAALLNSGAFEGLTVTAEPFGGMVKWIINMAALGLNACGLDFCWNTAIMVEDELVVTDKIYTPQLIKCTCDGSPVPCTIPEGFGRFNMYFTDDFTEDECVRIGLECDQCENYYCPENSEGFWCPGEAMTIAELAENFAAFCETEFGVGTTTSFDTDTGEVTVTFPLTEPFSCDKQFCFNSYYFDVGEDEWVVTDKILYPSTVQCCN